MRDAFALKLLELAQADPDIYVLAGDIGYGVFDKFREEFPDRFINMGIAEQNMVGVAAGMALSGKKPIVYTIAAFATARCYEQIRVDVCLHNLPVVIVGVGAGLSYGVLGPTHHALDDIALMRVLPNMTVVTPFDPESTKSLLSDTLLLGSPAYLRLSRNGEPPIDTSAHQSGDILIIACGPIVKVAHDAAELLVRDGVACRVVAVDSVKPLSGNHLYDSIIRAEAVVTLEEHSVIGGLGGAVAEFLAGSVSLMHIGIPDKFVTTIGDRDYLLKEVGLSAGEVALRIRDCFA